MNQDLIPAQRNTAPATILGAKRTNMTVSVAGRIRCGDMVLTQEAQADPRARTLYQQGIESGKSFDDIKLDIAAACPQLKHPLRPNNPAYFTVRPGDFSNPATADQLLAMYGEDHGDGRRLYRIPVIFPSDQWQAVMPHKMEAWSASELRFWSEYSEDGKTRFCMFRAPPPRGSNNKVVRVFGGRVAQPRQDNGGHCDPNNCQQFQDGQCNLSARFLFYVPGVPSLGMFELHTGSFYAMNNAIAMFEQVSFLRGGRLSGFLDNDGATFFLTKRLRNVSHINRNTGKPERKPQWIVELEAPVDVTALLRNSDPAYLLTAGAKAAAVLTGVTEDEAAGSLPQAQPDKSDARPIADEVILPDGSPLRTDATQRARAGAAQKAARGAPPAQATTSLKAAGSAEPGGQEVDDGLAPLRAQLRARRIDPEAYFAMLDQKTGSGWRRSNFGRRRVAEEIGMLDTSALQAKLHT